MILIMINSSIPQMKNYEVYIPLLLGVINNLVVGLYSFSFTYHKMLRS